MARLGRREFRLYVNRDILGVELCGALKNIIAIAAGAADGLGFGDNGKAGLMTRGLAEMTRRRDRRRREPADVRRAGRDRRRHRDLRLEAVAQPPARRGARERPAVGRDRGDPARASPRAPTRSTRRSRSPAALGVEMPIAREVHNALFEGKSVQRCLIDLLARESKDELADYGRWVERLGADGDRPGGQAALGSSGRAARLGALSGRGAAW